jgi:hypothetical protein
METNFIKPQPSKFLTTMRSVKNHCWNPILKPIYFFVGNATLTFLIIYSVFFLNSKKEKIVNISQFPEYQQSNNILSNNQENSINDIENKIDNEIEVEDARIQLVANFIKNNDIGKNSPLQPYDHFAKIFVEEADKNDLDFRLLPAIARKESTFCKSNVGKKYYNCFGWDVPNEVREGGKFESYEEGIATVARGLKKHYVDKGLTNIMDIMRKYCPPSANGEGTWATHINRWLAEMRFDDKATARQNIENAEIKAN